MKAVKCRSFTLLGIGTVGSGIVQILPSFVEADRLHILDRVPDLAARVDRLIAESLPGVREALKKIEIVTHVVSLTADNLGPVLRPLLTESQAVMDLTTCCDSESIMRLADECDCAYINACLEVFAEKEDLTEMQRHERFRAIRGEFRNTMVLEIGMNPGLISLLVNRALADSGFRPEEVATVHVTEYDTHALRPECRRDDCFYNTWSPFGLFEEAVKFAEMAWDGPTPPGWVPEGHLIHHGTKAGCEVSLASVTPMWNAAGDGWEFARYRGFLVTHGEVETISHKLNKKVRVAFVYHVCGDGRASLAKWGHGHAPNYVMMRGDAMTPDTVCADNIGALVVTRDGRGWWCGSLMKSVEGQRVGGTANNGANITVSAACLATVAWCIAHPNRGMLFPDDFDLADSEALLKRCEPFLGVMASRAVPAELLPHYDQPFAYSPIGHLPPP